MQKIKINIYLRRIMTGLKKSIFIKFICFIAQFHETGERFYFILFQCKNCPFYQLPQIIFVSFEVNVPRSHAVVCSCWQNLSTLTL